MSAPVPLNSGCCAPPCPDNPQTAVPGPAGENAFSLTTANFTQPAVGANVLVSLSHDGWVVPGQTVYVQQGGFYTVASVSGLTATLTNTGNTGNAAPGTVINSGAKVSPGGIGGNIGNAFTTTTLNYVQPNVGAQVNVQVGVSNWAAVGQRVFVATGGYYTVFSIPDGTHLNLTNDGDPGNAAPIVTTINSPQQVSPAGLRGPTGATGVSTLNGVSPTTTKGDIIADNGANSPLASDVRLGVGSNGKALVADSTQPTGLNYATITPNTAATSGDIVIFDGTSGTPMPVKDSKLLITADGAIQSTPTGGNARGTKAVDLQVTRNAVTQVASGNNSVVTGGERNTASATDSTVCGGNQNTASGASSTVGGGTTNTASGANSSVGAGSNNLASNTGASVAAGVSNTASGVNSSVSGGTGNVASGLDAGVGNGILNTASGAGSTVGGGSANTASTTYATIAGGLQSAAYLYGQHAHASGQFLNLGDAQASELLWRILTTDATANVESFLDGAALRAIVPLNTTWAFLIRTIARSSAGVCAMFETKGAIQNVAGTVTLVAAVTQTVIADGTGGTWGVTANHVVSADNVNKSLKVAVTGAALTNIRWVTHARLVEVNF